MLIMAAIKQQGVAWLLQDTYASYRVPWYESAGDLETDEEKRDADKTKYWWKCDAERNIEPPRIIENKREQTLSGTRTLRWLYTQKKIEEETLSFIQSKRKKTLKKQVLNQQSLSYSKSTYRDQKICTLLFCIQVKVE